MTARKELCIEMRQKKLRAFTKMEQERRKLPFISNINQIFQKNIFLDQLELSVSTVRNISKKINEIGNILPKRRLSRPKIRLEMYLRPIIKDINVNFLKKLENFFHKQ